MQALPSFEDLKRATFNRSVAVPKSRSMAVIKAAKTQRKVRAAAYCRVSTDHEDQKSSIAIQAQHLASVLAAHPEWENAGLYIDIGSGTKKERRPELQRLLEDCRAGRVTLILTKSISRFARSTTDLLEMVRTLTGIGATLIFEKEHIDTSAMDTEFLLTLLASLAADESQSIASNTRWGIQKRFRDGSYRPSVAPYGYDLVDGKYEVNPIESSIVREIFQSYLIGTSINGIACDLNKRGVSTKRAGQAWGNKVVGGKWTTTAVKNVLTNEVCLGVMILQKTTKDAAFNRIVNRGQMPLYRIIDHHPAIVDVATFEAVQEKLKKRSKPQREKHHHPFSGKVICGNCGANFNRYTNATDRVYWRCRSHILNASSCPQPGLMERKLEQLFVDVVVALKENDAPIVHYLNEMRQPHDELSKELMTVEKRLGEIGAEMNAERIAQRNRLQRRKGELEAEINSKKSLEERQTEELLQVIRSDSSVGFSGALFLRIIDHVIMHDAITFHFKGGFDMTREVVWPHKGSRTDCVPHLAQRPVNNTE